MIKYVSNVMICFSRLLAFAIPQLIDYVRCERDRKSSKANSEDKSERGEREKKKQRKKPCCIILYCIGTVFFLVYYYYGDTENLYDKNLFSLFVIP